MFEACELPKIGSIEFDMLSVGYLLIDIERRFESGQIKNFDEYLTLLAKFCAYTVVKKVESNKKLFQRILNECLIGI